MKKRCTPAKILAILLVLMMCFTTSCSLVKDSPTRLNTPSGLRVEDGSLYWNPIEYATKYLVSIDGNEFYSDDYRYSLAKVKNGEHKFKVKAIGDGVTYSSSDYSKEYITNIYDGHEASGDSYDHFDDLINGESFLGYGFDVIKSSVFSDKYVKLNFPIFDNEQLMQQRLLKVDSKNLYVNEVQSADIEEFIAQWNVSANVNVSWGGSVGLKAAYTGGTEATRSKYFHCISYNNQQFYIVMQSDMNTYRNMLSEGFVADLYSADIDPATLFEKYGTHFITSAIMGGRINSYYLYTSEETIDFHDVSAEVSVNIRYLMGQTDVNVGGGYNEYAKNHNINIKNTFEVIGGNNLGMKSDADIATYYTDWEKSLENSASLIGIKDAGSLQPIWELIDSSLDTKQYSWDYDGDGVYETGSRAQQLQAYFYAYGIENYNDLRSAAGVHEIVVPKEITNVKVNGQDALSTGEFEVYAGETNDITFNVLPDDATYTKKVSVADSVTYATINEYNQLILTADAPHNTTLNLVISAGNITKQITVKIIKAYTVEFETNFDIAVPSLTNVKYGRQIEEPELPNRDGYVLAGWYTSPDFNEETKFIFGEHAVTSNLILYARWVKEYSITYVLNGGEFSGSVIEKYTSISNLVLPTPSKAHYYFGGWYLDESLNNAASVDEIVNNPGNITLYAKWVGEGYTVTYVLNGGEFTSNVGGTYTIESGLVLPTPNKAYYDFGGWYLDESLNNAASEDEINENPRNITLYAKWVVTEYTVTYMLNGGELASGAADKYTIVSPLTLTAPSKAYYEFGGWYLDENLTTAASEDEINETPGNITLYAKWNTVTWTMIINDEIWVATGRGGVEGAVYHLNENYLRAYANDGYLIKITLHYAAKRIEGDPAPGTVQIVIGYDNNNNGTLDVGVGSADSFLSLASANFKAEEINKIYTGDITATVSPEYFYSGLFMMYFECNADDIWGDAYYVTTDTYAIISFVKA